MAECYSACGEYDCTCSPEMTNQCQERGFVFSIHGRLDPAVLDACQLAAARHASCEAFVTPDCELAAQVAGEWTIAAYDCLARTPCGSAQSCSLPPASSRAREFCGALDERCGAMGYRCTGAHEALLASAMAWYTPDTLSAGMECLSLPSCEAAASCHDAWLAALAVPRPGSLK